MAQVLLMHEDQKTLGTLRQLLRSKGYSVKAVSTPAEAEAAVRSDEPFDMMITSLEEAGVGNATLLKTAADARSSMPIAVIGRASERGALQQLGVEAYAFLEKPLNAEMLMATVQRAVDYAQSADGAVDLNLQFEVQYPIEGIVSESAQMQAVCGMVRRAASTDMNVLVVGEQGVGKSAVARAVHSLSGRRGGPLCEVDCSHPEAEKQLFGGESGKGVLCSAAGGSVLLGRIECLPRRVQVKLAGVLSGKKMPDRDSGRSVSIDVRLIATSRGVEMLPELSRLVGIVVIKVPALRERRADILPLFRVLVREACAGRGKLPLVEQRVLELIQGYSWPGNSAEMKAVVEETLKTGGTRTITAASLPERIKASQEGQWR